MNFMVVKLWRQVGAVIYKKELPSWILLTGVFALILLQLFCVYVDLRVEILDFLNMQNPEPVTLMQE